MDIRTRLLVHVAQMSAETVIGIDVGELLRALLLFDSVIIRSTRLADLGHLVRICGQDAALAIIGAEGLSIECAPAIISRFGEPLVSQTRNKLLRLDGLDYGVAHLYSTQFIESGFSEAKSIAGLTAGRARKFENVVRGRLIPVDSDARADALAQMKAELLNVSPSVHSAVRAAMRKRTGVELPSPNNYRIAIRFVDGRGFSAETDLPRVTGLPFEAVAAAVNDGLLGVGGLNQAIDDMRTHNSLTGLRPDDLPLLGDKLDFLAGQLDPARHAKRLTRVLSILNLPDLALDANARRASVERLLEVRQTPECRAFRDWLWSADSVTDEEITERFGGVRARLGMLVRGDRGKTLRWATGIGLGLLPGGGVISGAAGLLDAFVLEKLLPNRGPLSFLGNQYRSIF